MTAAIKIKGHAISISISTSKFFKNGCGISFRSGSEYSMTFSFPWYRSNFNSKSGWSNLFRGAGRSWK